MIKNLKKNNKPELNEIKFDTDMQLQHIEITDFDKFISIRLGYYATILAILALIFSNQELLNSLSIDIKTLIRLITTFTIIVICFHNVMAKKQREELIYCKFKLKCIDKIIAR